VPVGCGDAHAGTVDRTTPCRDMAAGIANRPRSQEGVSAGQRAILMSRRVSGGGLAHLGHTPSTSGFSPSRCVSRALSSANVRSRSVRRFVQRGNAGHDLQPADRDSIGLAHPHHGSSGSPPWGCSVPVGPADRARAPRILWDRSDCSTPRRRNDESRARPRWRRDVPRSLGPPPFEKRPFVAITTCGLSKMADPLGALRVWIHR